MITILHGTDTSKSRNAFFNIKATSKNTVLLEGNGLTYDVLFQTVENKSMFEDPYNIFVENFFSKNKSTSEEFKKIAGYLSKNNPPTGGSNVVFWEPDEISKSALSQFKSADVKIFTIPQALFQFLDNIKPNSSTGLISQFHLLQKSMETELIFFMIIRQFRILLGVSDSSTGSVDEVKRLAPWQVSKFKNQLSYFGVNDFKKIYQKLFELDRNQKTGKSPVGLSYSIDFFLLDL